MKTKEAIAEGYTYCVEEGSESVTHLSDVLKTPDDYKNREMYLCDKEPRFYSIDANRIDYLLTEHIEAEDEFYSETLAEDSMKGTDELIKALADKIKDNMANHKFWFNSGIKLEVG